MQLPFTTSEFLEVFRRYNEAIWPAQGILLATAIAAVFLVLGRRAHADRVVSAILALLWLWMGAVYHLGFFRAINPAAWIFGVAFIAQGMLLGWRGAWRGELRFAPALDAEGVAGGAMLLFALVAYPAVGHAAGRHYPAIPTFGLPCPTTIFTLGMLLWARGRGVAGAMAIPVLWAAVGTSAAAQLGMVEDYGLGAAALVAVSLVAWRQLKGRGTPAAAG